LAIVKAASVGEATKNGTHGLGKVAGVGLAVLVLDHLVERNLVVLEQPADLRARDRGCKSRERPVCAL